MRVREAPRQREQPLRARTGEAVDRLVVVADDAEVVAIAEPEVEQRLLEQVDVLVLVDGERLPARAHGRERLLVVLERTDREPEQVLEVDRARLGLPLLVLPEDTQRETPQQRWLVTAEPCKIGRRREPPVLRPLDLRREVAGGPEAKRLGQAVADPPEEQRLRREDPPGSPSKRRSSASAAEWNVEARTPSTPSAASRARNSPAALSVKVTATIDDGSMQWCRLVTCQAMRRVIVVVLPVPAPARMQTGPRVASAAARCSAFSPPRMRSASTAAPYRGGRSAL